jgi:hypothetical protein
VLKKTGDELLIEANEYGIGRSSAPDDGEIIYRGRAQKQAAMWMRV